MSALIKNGVLYGADDIVSEWVQRRLGGIKAHRPCVALGVTDGNDLLGGIVFFNATDSDIQCAVAAVGPQAAKPRAMAQIFAYPFVQLGLERVSAEIELDNERSIKLARGLGFVREGTKRRAAPGGRHVGVFGLLRQQFHLNRYL